MKINNTVQLREAIALLKAEAEEKRLIMIDQFHDTYDSLKPINLIKTAFHKVADLPDLASQVIGTSIGVGAGILSKKILIGKSTNIFKKLFGVILEFAIAGAVAKNSNGIKRQGAELFKKLVK